MRYGKIVEYRVQWLEFVLRMMLTTCAVEHFRRLHKIAKSDYWLCHVCPSVRPSAWNNSAAAGRTFVTFYIGAFFVNLSRKFKFLIKIWQKYCVRYMKTNIHFIISPSIRIRIRNISDKCYRENKITRLIFSNFFFRKLCCLWDNVEKYCEARQTADEIWCMRTLRCVPKATYIHSEYITLIAFPL
jgi:hypothetical protein